MSTVESQIIDFDLQHHWHPCSQMKDYEILRPLLVTGANNSHIELSNGQKIIDAISSWWCKSLGHNHPRLKKAITQQMEKFEHVIFANTTHDAIVNLSKHLIKLTTNLDKIFYAGDGSCAVEIAMKMSLHSRVIQQQHKRNRFVALENGYHGETIGAMSVSDIGIYKAPYNPLLFETLFISPIPYVTSTADPLWLDCTQHWQHIEKLLEPHIETTTAILLEPIVQGAGGMKIYSQDLLRYLRKWTEKHDIHLIADEIMTGLGRTGKMLALDYANIEPDFLCVSKGLTSGWLPFSAVLTSQKIYDYFYDDYEAGKSFLHSHTFCGNALAASIAVEVFNIIEEQDLCQRANFLGKYMLNKMLTIADSTQKLTNVRQIGAIVAADLLQNKPNRRLGFEIYQKALNLGALLRPLGNTIYWLPPLNTEFEIIDDLATITEKALMAVK